MAAVSRLVSRATDAGLTGIAANPAADIARPTETRRDTLGCDGTRAQAGHKRDTPECDGLLLYPCHGDGTRKRPPMVPRSLILVKPQ